MDDKTIVAALRCCGDASKGCHACPLYKIRRLESTLKFCNEMLSEAADRIEAIIEKEAKQDG